MNIKILDKEENKLMLLIFGTNYSIVNALRRSIMEEVPVMAIEEVTFIKNSSALYDEITAHRLGLLPLSTDLLSYNLKEECKCKGKGCARCQLKFALEAKGPCIVYAENLKSKDPKVKPVNPKMPITQLLKGQTLQLEAVAVLGNGKEHAKFSPGLVYYKAYPTLKVTKDSNVKKCAEMSNNLVVKGNKLEFKDITKWNEAQEQICEKNKVEIEYSEEDFIFVIESWGQLEAEKLVGLGVDYFSKKLKELQKLVK